MSPVFSRLRALQISGWATALWLAMWWLPRFSLFPGNTGEMLNLHLLLETAAILVSVLVVVMAWHAFTPSEQKAAPLLVCGFTVVAFLDFVHAASYDGMPSFFSPSSTEKAIFFWLAGRSVELLTVWAVAVRLALPGSARLWQALALVFCGVWFYLGTYALHLFPTLFVPGQGVTDFKAGFEVLLCVGNWWVAYLFWRRPAGPNGKARDHLFAASCWVMGLGELTFTTYVQASDFLVMFGHAFKVLAYGLIYWAVFEIGWRQPFERLRASETALSELKTAINAHAIVALTDDKGTILEVNDKFCQISQYSEAELLGQNHRLINSGTHPRSFFVDMWKTIAKGEVWTGEVCNRAKDGSLYWVNTTVVPYLDDKGRPKRYLAIRADITRRKLYEMKVQELAYHDALTGLPNRVLLLDRLQHAMDSTAANGQWGAVMFMDLDHFKEVNDSLGHEQGDQLLKQVAVRLQSAVQPTDTVSRIGGDEFVIVLDGLGTSKEAASALAGHRGEHILRLLGQPYPLAAGEARTSPSIGVVMFSGHAVGTDEVFKHADLAMYQAKDAGRNTLCFFDPAVQAAFEKRHKLASHLRHALDRDEMVVFYQPIVNEHRQVVGAEALLRWRHPTLGMVSPVDFIPLAEKTGLIVPIGTWVLEQVCALLGEWRQVPERAHMQLAVNVSERQLRQDDFVPLVIQTMAKHQVPVGRLKLEITESMLMTDMLQTVQKMTQLRAAGVAFSIDDFGTGYSSLSYLNKLPIDVLKIDRSFVMHIDTQESELAIARTVLSLAQHLGLQVVAEGVETEAQFEMLCRHGCHMFQGYLFSKPLELSAFMETA